MPAVPDATYKLKFLDDQIFTRNQNADVRISETEGILVTVQELYKGQRR